MKLKKILLTTLAIGAISANAKDLLPGNIILDVRTDKFESVIQNIEDFATQAVAGTPFAMQVQKGMLKQMLPMVTKLPPGAIDMQKPVRFVMSNPKKGKAPAFAIYLPVVDAKKTLSTLPGAQKQPDGTCKLMDGTFLAPTSNNYLTLSDSKAQAKAMAKTFPLLNQSKKKSNKTITATVDIQKILRLNKADIEDTSDITASLSQAAAVNPQLLGMTEFVKTAYTESLELLKQAKAVQLLIDINGKSLDIQTALFPKSDSELSNIAKAYSKIKPDYGFMAKLPQGMPMIFSAFYAPEVSKNVQNIMMRFVKPMKDAKATNALAKSMEASFSIYNLFNGQAAASMAFDSESMYKMTGYYSVIDSKTFLDEYGKATVDSMKAISEFYKSMGLPVKMKANYTKNAGKVEGINYSLIKMLYEPTKEKDALSAVEQAQIAALAAQPEMTFAIAAVDQKTVAIVMNNDYKTTLETAIKNYRNNSTSSEKNAAMLKPLPYNQFGSAVIYPLDLTKQVMLMQLNTTKKTLEKSGMAAATAGIDQIIAMMKTLPNSKHPILSGLGATSKSLRSELQVPSKAISEIVMATMNAYMQVQMQQMQKMK